MIPYDRNLRQLSRNLRNNLTKAEQCLWSRLRSKQLGYTFYRQKPVGDYIVDFYCPKARLVVEVDGSNHFKDENHANDRIRDDYMRSLGITTLRFTNAQVLENINSVVETITEFLNKT